MNRSLLKAFSCPIAITILCLFLGLWSESVTELFQYERSAILAGAWWRLITGHLVHLGWEHLLMNLAGLWLIWHLFAGHESLLVNCAFRLPLLTLGTSLGLLWLTPELAWYRGLSGILHGLLIALLLEQLRRSPRSSALLLVLIGAKLVWEQLSGPLPGSESWVQGRVIVDAHLYGSVSGIILWAIGLAYSQFIHREVKG